MTIDKYFAREKYKIFCNNIAGQFVFFADKGFDCPAPAGCVEQAIMEKADWQVIVPKYAGLVWQTSFRLVGNYTDACDCFQDTFVCAFEVSSRSKFAITAAY